MNFRMISTFLLLFISSYLCGFGGKTVFVSRPQGVNSTIELVGWQQEIHKESTGKNYGTAAFTIEYDQSFRSKKIAQFLFDSECLVFSGSLIKNRGERDILADYFGLPFGFKSKINFNPVITNVIFDSNWYKSLDSFIDGLYIRLHAPIVHTRWDLELDELIIQDQDPTIPFYPAGYMGSDRITREQMHTNATEAFKGKKNIGDREPLRFGKIFGKQKTTRLSAIQGILGWNFLLQSDGHLGLFIRTSAPTGNRPNMEFLFEPIAGNMHHWELGAGLTSHYILWLSEDEKNALGIYFDANITHLFTDKQKRSYDLKNKGRGSRYILLQEFSTMSTNLQLGPAGPDAPNQYTGRLFPAINKTTLLSKIRINVQADVVLKLAYQHNGFECDIGYNFWTRSKEKLINRCSLPANRFAIKGDAQVYGFADPDDTPVRLNATQSKATINKAQDPGNFVANAEFENRNIDSPVGAFDGNGNDLERLRAEDAGTLGLAPKQANTSNPPLPLLLSDDDIDECSALLPRAISHKLFVHFDHVWRNDERLDPYIGGGVAAEWADTSSKDNSAHSHWALWVKGGLTY